MKMSLLCLLALATFVHGEGKELEGTRAAANTPCPSPEEARAKMTVPEGYEVHCWAHEPMVQNPVAMTWDARGRLWVVEAYEYPEGTPLPEAKRPFGQEAKDDKYHPMPALESVHPKDRVIILEDTDNDGEADKRTVFVEGLNLASAIICGDDGIYVGQQPHLFHFKDSNHDDKPDEWRVILTGFGREDTHELVNSFCWGPDGWLYMTHGVFTNSKVRRPGQPESEGFKFDAGIGRCRPTTTGKEASWEFEVFADGTSNPWGCDYDERGNFFVSACVIDHFFHMAPGGIYVRQGGAPENPYAYELLPSIVKHKHFRAAYAGIQIYQGGVYPKDTWGHAFIGNIHDNAIHEEVLTPVGSTFKCEPRRDFLRANDGWFRPVSTRTGPDGNLWIMDWCDKYPCYQNAKANPEGVDRERGRIWRVVHTDPKTPVASRPTKEMDLSKLDTPALVKLLGDSNNWMRRWARRELIERNRSDSAAPLLQKLIAKVPSVPECAEAAVTLKKLGLLTEALLQGLAKSPNPGHRIIAARFSEGSVWEVLAADPDAGVRLTVATKLRETTAGLLTKDRTPLPIKRKSTSAEWEQLVLTSKDDADQVLSFMLWEAYEPEIVVALEPALRRWAELSSQCQPLSHTLTYKSMRRVCDTRKPENLDLVLDFLTKIKAHDVLLAHALDGLEKGQEGGIIKPRKDFATLLAEFAISANAVVRKHAQSLRVLWGDAAAIDQLVAIMLDAKTKESERIAAVQALRKVRNDAAKAGFAKLIDGLDWKVASESFAVEVMRAGAELGGDAFARVASGTGIMPIAGGSAARMPVLLATLASLTSRADWTHQLLDTIAKNKLSAGSFPATLRRQLATSKDKAIRDHAFKVLGAWKDSSDDVKAHIAAKKQACLTGEPDLAAGKLIFTTTCAVCHVFHGGGQKVGPDLIGSGRSNLDALLANVIDPNQIIGNGYENFTLSTKDNRTLMGRVLEDTPSHVKLQAIGGAETVVPRDQIAKLENTHQSLMPMGFGGLPDDQFRNLIWYVLAPPEEGVLTPDKKKLLSASIDAPAKNKNHAIDWESVSLWNPKLKVIAPEFDRTPVKLAEYHRRTNVLIMHPFEDKKTPAVLEQKLTVDAAKAKLKFSVAADDRGDWLFKAVVNGQVVKEMSVDHEKPRWKDIALDLSAHTGKEITVRLESHPTGWSWEFSYWHNVRWE